MRTVLLIVMIGLCFRSFSQSTSPRMGARAQGMAYACTGLEDAWALFNNVGGLASVDAACAAITYDAMPAFRPFDRQALVAALPTRAGVAGVGFYRFGDALYNEHIATAGFANTFGIASLGVSVNYVQYQAEGFGSRGFATFSLGGITHLSRRLAIGAYASNLHQPALSRHTNERLPTFLAIGLAYTPTENLHIATEVEMDLYYPALWKAALEYRVHKLFRARGGFQLYPAAAFMGFGLQHPKFTFDYAFQYQPYFAARHQATVGYRFKKAATL